jgi:DNA-binding response OmpR family regulator
MRLGCIGYMAKPFAPGDLLGRVARAVARRAVPRADCVEI